MKINEILDLRGISYKDKGKDFVVVCLNPEHDDSSPSMYIDKELGVYHCYACGFKGKSIFELLGVEAPRVSPVISQFKRKLQELSIFSFGLRLPEARVEFDTDFRDIKAETYKQLEAFTHSQWHGRLCFPITDLVTGHVCAVVQRNMFTEVPPKYLVYPHGVKLPIYPASQENGVTVLVEGIFDVANLLDKGLTNAAQLFGVSTITHHSVDSKCLPLIAADTKKVVILLDNDEAGISQSKSVAKLLGKHFKVHIQTHILPQGADPGGLGEAEVKYLKKYINDIDWNK